MVSDLTAASGNGTDLAAVGLDSSLKGCTQEVSTSALVHGSQSRRLAEQPSYQLNSPCGQQQLSGALLAKGWRTLGNYIGGTELGQVLG